MSVPRIGLAGFGDRSAIGGPLSVAVLRQHFLGRSSLGKGSASVGAMPSVSRTQAGHNLRSEGCDLAC